MQPSKAEKNVEIFPPRASINTITSRSSFGSKPKKQKPLSKRDAKKIQIMEKEMKEELIRMNKEAITMLAEFEAMEEAAVRKAKQEEQQQAHRVKLLSQTCEKFKSARMRLIHENNKIREQEIWKRYITTDQKPYPECTPHMNTCLYVWKQQKVTEDIDCALNQCDTYVETLDLLNELIEYPLYAAKETVANWKELRTEWRREYLERIDESCYHLIKNLSKNFRQKTGGRERLDEDVYTFEFQMNHLKLNMSAWAENNKTPPSLKRAPKFVFKSLEAEIVMPAAYKQKPFILRLAYLDRDFFSDDSLTSSPPLGLPMETDLLNEVNRCIQAKKEAELSVADREREKVRAAKQKVTEAQEAVIQAEKSFRMVQEQTKEYRTKKQSAASLKSERMPQEDKLIEERSKKTNKESQGKVTEPASHEPSINSKPLKRRGAPEIQGDPSSTAMLLVQSAGAMKTLDAISMRSGMRKKQDKVKRIVLRDSQEDADRLSIFKTRSMVSVPDVRPGVRAPTKFRRDSTLCFEEIEISSDESRTTKRTDSFESLDLLLGAGEEAGHIPTLKQLLKRTVVIERETKPKLAPKATSTSYSWDGKRKKNRGKSILSGDKRVTVETDELPPTASDIFEAKEDARQELYLASLYFPNIPQKQHHLNLRMNSIVGGTYLLDVIEPVPQHRQLANGTSVQIIYGDKNIKRDEYEYEYIPPRSPRPDDDPADPVPDQGLPHLLHVKIPLPKKVIFFEPPGVTLWDRVNEYWSDEHVRKEEINMEEKVAKFGLSRIMPFAFYLKKFALLPYTAWVLKPKHDTGGVSLKLNSTLATVEFHVKDFGVSLASAETHSGENITEVEDIIGKKMQLHKLIAIMKSRGIDVFPDNDSCLYTENSAKDVVLEEHTNLSVAMWSDTLEFQGYEWNGELKRRKLAFRVRECLAYNLELRFRTVVARCLSATIYRAGMEDVAIDESKAENYGFSPDVADLLEKAFTHMGPSRPVNPLQVLSVYSLLCRTKVHSYCGTTRTQTPSSSSDESRKSGQKRTKKRANPRSRNEIYKSSDETFSEFSTQ